MPNTLKCPACNFRTERPFEVCPKCGVVVQKFLQKQAEREQVKQSQRQAATAMRTFPGDSEIEVASKYGAMTIISIAIKALAVIIVLVGVLGLFQGGAPVAIKAGALSGCIIAAVLMWAYSEAIYIGIDTKENQRKLIKLLLSKP